MDIIRNILKKSLFKREILPSIIKWLPNKEAVVIVGSRQVGKSSLFFLLIQHLVQKIKINEKDIFYLDLEIRENLEMLNEGVDKLINFIDEQSPQNTKKFIFIDEIQYLENPSSLLKILVDHYADKLKVFATGSSALTIKRKFKDSLVGRKITFELYSLNFKEYLVFKKEDSLKEILNKVNLFLYPQAQVLSDISHSRIMNYYYEYSVFGGYPAIVLIKEYEKKKKYLEDIYNSYVRKDINVLFSLENLTAFNRLIKLLAINIGNLINIQTISKEIGLARQTIEKYFSILESTYICNFIQPYFTNKRKEIVKMPKVYFYDTGLRNRVINDFRKVDDRVDSGCLMENSVFKNLLGVVENKENIKFWRLKYGVEVDFVIDENEILPIEIKVGRADRISTGISSFLNNYKLKKSVIINKKIFKDVDKVKFRPFYSI
ncbi:MAG: ATP-binding protein [Candidatus Omnitrophica bacterium]|nr:ATP-binding protein [Candidatus Omnitrophota bacterium]